MRQTPHICVRIVIGLVCLVGLIGVLPVSYAELRGALSCPHLGPVPACHLVSIAYLAVGMTVISRLTWRPAVFITGWLVIFVLAAIGTGLELTGAGTCPKTQSGIPKCYFSLGLAGLLFIPLVFHYVASGRRH